uniref:FERM domain containing 3 n=1 Tax=Hucho hucho TaxID=62062 RepID=A0A4W5QF91_9TELE
NAADTIDLPSHITRHRADNWTFTGIDPPLIPSSKKLVLTFHTSTPAACKHLWKCGVENQRKEEETSGVLTISELVYNPCASMLPTPVDDGQGGVDLLFQSPIQSPARLLRELHADPDIQVQLEAERVRDRAFERARVVGRSMLGSGLRLLTRNERVNTCVLSAARLIAMVIGVLLVAVPMLLLLLESDIDVSFLHEIRQTPEFEQFHYEYYCPLRRWILCKIRRVAFTLYHVSVCSLLMLTS